MRLLLLEPEQFSPEARAILEPHFEFVTNSDTEVIWTRFRRVGTRNYPSLRLVVAAVTGPDHLPSDIETLTLKGETEFLETIHATAEYTIGLILALIRKIPYALYHSGADRMRFCGTELHGKTVLVVGAGRVGKQVGDILQAFGCLVLYADRHSPLDKLLPLADIVTVHTSLDTSRSLFTSSHFGLMKQGAFFINTSRREVIDELALREAIRSHHLAGAAIDFGEYHLAQPNLMIMPHLGGCTVESMAKTEIFLASKLVQWLTKQP